MRRIGAHISISKGLDKACSMTEEIEGNTFQFFTRNPRGGKARRIEKAEIDLFSKTRTKKNIFPIMGHLPYTVNMAAEKSSVYNFALEIVGKDLVRGERIGAEYLVVHPGRNKDRQEGIKKITTALEEKLGDFKGQCILLLEAMAGSGSEIGLLKDLKIIVDNLGKHPNLGICLDSCHLFAAGWDFRKQEMVLDLKDTLDKYFGLEIIKVMHLNDALFPPGSGKDRHARIGQGYMGDEGIKNLIKDDFFSTLPFILETPVENYREYGEDIREVLKLWGKE